MKHKKLCIAGIVCVLSGLLLCAIAYRSRGPELFAYTTIRSDGKLGNENHGEHHTYDIEGDFTTYKLDANIGEVEIVRGDRSPLKRGICRVWTKKAARWSGAPRPRERRTRTP